MNELTEPTEAHLQEACDLLNGGQVCGFELPEDQRHYAVVAIARIIANQQPAPELANLWAELAKHTSWELAHGCWDEEGPQDWHVHSVNGGRNDREWTLLGEGETPEAAILAALDASKPDPLYEALHAVAECGRYDIAEQTELLRFELKKRGLHITETHND